LEFLNSEPYYASKKIVNQSSDFPVRRTGSYRRKKALSMTALLVLVLRDGNRQCSKPTDED